MCVCLCLVCLCVCVCASCLRTSLSFSVCERASLTETELRRLCLLVRTACEWLPNWRPDSETNQRYNYLRRHLRMFSAPPPPHKRPSPPHHQPHPGVLCRCT